MINWQDFIAGWIGGCSGLIVGHPLDTIKVRQQILHAGLFKTIKTTFKYEGFFGFYKGVAFPLLIMGPSNSIFFGVYSNCIHLTQGTKGDRVNYKDPNWKYHVFTSGCFAGSFQALVNSPVELVKTILQVQTKHKTAWKPHYESAYTGMWDCLKGVFKERGLRGIYRGFNVLLCRDVPTSGLYTLTYEILMHHQYPFDALNHTLIKQIISGGFAGIMSWATVIPLDVVKSRVQADNPNNPKYNGMIDCFVKSYKEEGIGVFKKGALVVCCRAFPANAAIFVTYEYVLKLLHTYT